MPRHNAVDYPQVPHRPIVQMNLGLAPPPSFTDQDRYSWQVTPVEATSPNGEEQYMATNNKRKQLEQRETQGRQSRIPPLPVLPDHLAHDGRRESRLSTYVLLPSQRRDLGLAQAQQHKQTRILEEQEHVAQFRPDLSRQHQSQPQVVTQEQNFAYPYEQSQHLQHQPRIAEQAVVDSPNSDDARFYTHYTAQPNVQHVPLVNQFQRPEERKIPIPSISIQHLPQAQPAQIAPDENPLTATSPSLVNNSVNARTINQPIGVLPEMHFPQSTHFNQQQTIQGSTWHHSLGSCADPTTCLSSLFCPCMIYGRTQHRLSLKSSGKDPTNMLGFSSLNASCLAWSILPGVNVLLTAIQHRRIRKAYDMDGQAGNFVGDCVKGVCCCCCMLAQAEKEMKVREISVAKITDEYKSPADMSYVPQAS